jgi:hypothetical protein
MTMAATMAAIRTASFSSWMIGQWVMRDILPQLAYFAFVASMVTLVMWSSFFSSFTVPAAVM